MSLVKAIVVIGTSAIALGVLAWLAVLQTNEVKQMAPSRKIGPSNTVRATDEPMSPMTYISMDALPRISSALRNALRNGKITVNELEKLDFTNLDSLDFDKATSYKVLNPKSPRAIFSKAKPLIPQSILDLITIQKGSKPVINMRRVIRQDGATIDRLVMILSDVRPDMCVNPVNGTSNEGDVFQIASNSSTLMLDNSQFWGGCILATDQKLYFVGNLVMRIKKAGDETWQTY